MNIKRLAGAIALVLVTIYLIVVAILIHLYDGVGNDNGASSDPVWLFIVLLVLAALTGYAAFRNIQKIKK